jgi:hypothetical protein
MNEFYGNMFENFTTTSFSLLFHWQFANKLQLTTCKSRLPFSNNTNEINRLAMKSSPLANLIL